MNPVYPPTSHANFTPVFNYLRFGRAITNPKDYLVTDTV